MAIASDGAERWFLDTWSREAGRGAVRSASGSRLPFDASAATVADFFLGEEVRVRTDGARVLVVDPVHKGEAAQARLEVEVSVTPTGYLSLREPSDHDEAFQELENFVFDRLGIASLVHGDLTDLTPRRPDHWRHGFITDAGPELRALLEDRLGRPVDDLVEVNAEYPFSWDRLGDLDALFGGIARKLPGYNPENDFFASGARTSGNDLPPPPYIWWSIEPIGLQIAGVLPRSDWTRWRAAFELATAHIPMRKD